MLLPYMLVFAGFVLGQDTTNTQDTTTTTTTNTQDTTTQDTTDLSLTEAATPTGPYLTYTSQRTLATSSSGSTSIGSNSTHSSHESSTTTKNSIFVLSGSAHSTTTLKGNFSTSATTSSSATPSVTNTRPCNSYPEFCSRKYSNITEIACHNSPFITPNNIAANQQYDVSLQLDDGVRFLQAQIQWPTNGTEPHFCHTSCDILDAGPITDWLGQVKTWVASHPYDVVTILLGNGNYSVPSLYVPFIESTGILTYVYTPPLIPMTLNDWPTLSEMILTGKRVVMFMDYMANQTQYPWLLDEFSQMWETPFDPTDQSFPCDVQRPPNLSANDTRNRLSLMNHNLNIELSIMGASLLVPAREQLNVTNNVTGIGSLGVAGQTCQTNWGRPPNFLNVDYYNDGGYPGSVFEVAAQFNNVTYSGKCCGIGTSDASSKYEGLPIFWIVAMGVAMHLLWI